MASERTHVDKYLCTVCGHRHSNGWYCKHSIDAKDATIARLEAENAGLRAECLAWRERAGKRGYLTGQWITDGKILVGGGKRMPEADATDAAGWLKPKDEAHMAGGGGGGQ